MVDLKAEMNLLRKPILESIDDVLKSGNFVLGVKGKELEEQISSYVNCQYALGVGNGTDALYLALKALDIGVNDEVITTPFTFFATAEAIAQVGAKPVFVDIEEDTYNIDPSKIEAKITTKTKAIVVVHLFGRTAKMDKIKEIAEEYNLKIIEDSCQAIGSEFNGERVGALGDIGCFSFFPSKNLGAYGDGGMVVTNNKKLYLKVLNLRNHGSRQKYIHTNIGTNSRLDEIQAAILLFKLKYLDVFLHKRKEVAKRYTMELNHLVKTPPIFEDRGHTFHQYSIELDERDELADFLKEYGISTAIYYPIPLHLQEAFHYLQYREGDFPIAEKASTRILALPICPFLTFENQSTIMSTIQKFFKKDNY